MRDLGPGHFDKNVFKSVHSPTDLGKIVIFIQDEGFGKLRLSKLQAAHQGIRDE